MIETKRAKTIVLSLVFVLVLFSIVVTTTILNSHKVRNNDVFMHISFDDTINVFEDLTNNAASYDSIFDNEFLSFLKYLHDQYGAVFSFYCYYENDHFNLSQSTEKFASEFETNSYWLKFGYHSCIFRQ